MPDFKKDIEGLKDKLQDDEYAKAFYAALCNNLWRSTEDVSYSYGCSWRYAGELVARLREKGEDYLDFYLSGSEGFIREDVRLDLKKLGYVPEEYPEEEV